MAIGKQIQDAGVLRVARGTALITKVELLLLMRKVADRFDLASQRKQLSRRIDNMVALGNCVAIIADRKLILQNFLNDTRKLSSPGMSEPLPKILSSGFRPRRTRLF
jgi:hypothetical protein